jgi:predicted murein hydrolase (TIGR00659 family)
MTGVDAFWVYLQAGPLLWLVLTLGAYSAAFALFRLGRGNPLLNPVAIAVALIVVLLVGTGTDYQTYFQGAQFVHFLLGPATVALGLPLWRNLGTARRLLVPMVVALLAGSATAIASAVGVAALFGASHATVLSVAPKSVTTPIAMAISEQLGGLPSLTAALVILTGIIGAIAVTPLMNALRIGDWRVRGFAAGLAAHGIGTARAFQVNQLAGTFAGIAMGLNGLITALLAPLLLGWLR